MTTVHAHLDEPLEQAAATLRHAVAEQGWSILEAESDEHTLRFQKGLTATSWGSAITATLESPSPLVTKLSFATQEAWAVTDWGRGRRQVAKLLEALGAEKD